MPTPSHDSNSKTTKQNRAPRVPNEERSRPNAQQGKEEQRESTKEARAKRDDERSDWEGMTRKPEQGEDDVSAPGELPETD